MILKYIKIFTHNVHKNNFIINISLKTQCFFNIIFIQESSWSFICLLSCLKNSEGEKLIRVPNHSSWMTFSRNTANSGDSPRVITYINIRLMSLCFFPCKDIFNYQNISCDFFVNCSLVYFLINVYLDSLQLALKCLKDTEVDINNVLIMTSDFNIRDCSWDSNFRFHSIHKDILLDIADFFHLEMSKPTNCIPTKYSANQQELDLVIDLIFLRPTSLEYDNHSIHPDWHQVRLLAIAFQSFIDHHHS